MIFLSDKKIISLEMGQFIGSQPRELRWAQKDFPEDVYRHALWSFLLTKEYGSEFSQLVTNAHEHGSYNSEEEMPRDRQNNKIGIAYAQSNVPEAKLLSRIKSGPRIKY